MRLGKMSRGEDDRKGRRVKEKRKGGTEKKEDEIIDGEDKN
jgi:hypothetical protein